MSRIRTIKPEFFKHEDLFEAEAETGLPLRLAFIGLWTVSDREGRFPWRPRALKTDIIPYDDVNFSRVLDALATRGFVVKYASEGAEFGFIPSWKRHQVINNREAASTIPEPTEVVEVTDASATRDPRVTDLHVQAQGEGKGREGERKGKEAPNGALSETAVPDASKAKSRKRYPDDFEQAWKAYPTHRNMSKSEATVEWRKLSAGDRQLVLPSIPSFLAYCKANPTYTVIHFCRYLKLRRFEGHLGEGAMPASDVDWRGRLKYAREHRTWASDKWGPAPGREGCRVPPELIIAGDGEDWSEFRSAA